MAYSTKHAPFKTKRMEGDIVRRVLESLDKPKVSGIDRRTYRGRRDACIVKLLAQSGMRISEVVNLRLGDVSEMTVNGESVIQFQFAGKGGRIRRAILANGRREFVLDYLARRPGPKRPDSPLFFHITRGGRTVYDAFPHRGYVNRLLATLAERLGIERLTPHMFRHSLASRLAEKNIGIFQLMQVFGWSQVQTANRYVTISPAAQAEISALGW